MVLEWSGYGKGNLPQRLNGGHLLASKGKFVCYYCNDTRNLRPIFGATMLQYFSISESFCRSNLGLSLIYVDPLPVSIIADFMILL